MASEILFDAVAAGLLCAVLCYATRRARVGGNNIMQSLTIPVYRDAGTFGVCSSKGGGLLLPLPLSTDSSI